MVGVGSAASARDEAWFERLYERHHRAVWAYCVRRVGAADGPDACAQVFTVAWRRCTDVPDGERALPWLYGVARRVVSHAWRSRDRARRLAEKAGQIRVLTPPGPDAMAVTSAEHELVRSAVMTLADNDREVLLLSAWEGLTHGEIAEVIGCSRAAVDKRLARAKRRLARRYEALTHDGAAADAGLESTERPAARARGGGRDR